VRSLGSVLVALCLWGAACGTGRDLVPETHDVRGASVDLASPDAQDRGGYEYVAKRALCIVGLAEARGIEREVTTRTIDTLADSLEACAENLSGGGKLVDGAARIAAEVSAGGVPSGLALKVSPGGAVAANAILCFIAPFKLTSFPAVGPDAPPRGLAIEAAWGPHVQGRGDALKPSGRQSTEGSVEP
jgi:hypothetical protein